MSLGHTCKQEGPKICKKKVINFYTALREYDNVWTLDMTENIVWHGNAKIFQAVSKVASRYVSFHMTCT